MILECWLLIALTYMTILLSLIKIIIVEVVLPLKGVSDKKF